MTEMHREKGSGLEPWPKRLTTAPPRLGEIGVSVEEFLKDTVRLLTICCAPVMQFFTWELVPFFFGLNLYINLFICVCDAECMALQSG